MLGLIQAARATLTAPPRPPWHGPPVHEPNSPNARPLPRRILSHLSSTLRPLASPTARPWLILAAIANAMTIVAGAPQYVVYLGWMQIVAVLVALPLRRTVAGFTVLAATWTIALALSAPQWVPTLSYLPYTARMSNVGAGNMTAPPTDELKIVALELLLPFPLGDDLRTPHVYSKNVWETGTWAGSTSILFTISLALSSIRRFLQMSYNLLTQYFVNKSNDLWRSRLGVRKLAFAPAASLTLRPISRARDALPLALLALCLYVALGGWLPGFGGFREILKIRAIAGFALALGAAAGLHRLLALIRLRRCLHFAAALNQPPLPTSRRITAIAPLLPFAFACAIYLIFAIATLLYTQTNANQIGQWLADHTLSLDPKVQAHIARNAHNPALLAQPLKAAAAAAIISASILTTLILILVFRRSSRSIHASPRPRPCLILPLLVILSALEPFAVNSYCFYSQYPFKKVELPTELRAQLEPLIEQTRKGEAPPWRVVLPNHLMNRGCFTDWLFETGGYDPLMPANANNRMYLSPADPGDTTASMLARTNKPDAAQLRRAAIAKMFDLRDWPTTAPRLELLHLSSRIAIASAEQQVVAGSTDSERFGPRLDGTHFVIPGTRAGKQVRPEELGEYYREWCANIISNALNTFDGTPSTLKQAWFSTAKYESLPSSTPSRWIFKTAGSFPTLLVFRTTWLQGWTYQIDDRLPERALLANNWSCAAFVPSGPHTVTFTYRPVGLTLALFLAGFTAAVLLCMVLVFGTRRSRAPRNY